MRHKRPDNKNALSLLKAAEGEMKFILTLKPTDQSGTTIIRNIYESFRMLGDALLVLEGVESEDHLAPIKKLISLKINVSRPLNILDNLRRLRHNLNYYGYKPGLSEVLEIISIAKTLFPPLAKYTKERILNTNCS